MKSTITIIMLLAAPALAQPTTAPAMQKSGFAKTITTTLSLQYLAYFPSDYGRGSKFPLLIALHGSGECGHDLDKIVRLPKSIINDRADFPFVLITPQLPSELEGWSPQTLDAMLDHLLDKYDVDPDRVYAIGHSWGAYGVWDWACHSPQRFAAIAPISGEPNTDLVERLLHVPVWAFHGANDKEVWPHEDQKMIKLLQEKGGEAKLTIYEGVGHNAWSRAYADPQLYEWLLSHHRTRPGVP